MLSRFHSGLISIGLAATLQVLTLGAAEKGEAELQSKLDAAKKRIPTAEFELRYKFRPGEVVKTQVVHLATTETKIQGNTQTSKSRSVSTKVWRIQEVAADGSIRFVHSVESVEMWQQVSERPEVRYDSRTDKTPPPEYEMVAETIGVPLATITMSPSGEVVTRDKKRPASLGLGEIALPLPTGKVKIGHEWNAPDEIFVRLPDNTVKRISIRKNYTLEKVQTGVATIRVRTQVLTPVNDARIQSQLVQQLTNGTIRFDVDAGRILAQQMDWDESVVGFSGPESMMQYLARFTEELVESKQDEPPAPSKDKRSAVKPAGPDLRR